MGTESNVANLKLSFNLLPNQSVQRKQALPEPIIKPRAILGEHIRRVRMERYLKVSELAQLLGITSNTLKHWRSHPRMPACSPATIKLVQFLGFMPFPMNTLQEQLYAVRAINGWTQKQASDQLKAPPPYWQQLESGKKQLEVHEQKRLTLFLQKHLFTKLKALLPNTTPPDI